MGSFAITSGTVIVRSCPEAIKIIEDLRTLADGMDEHDVITEKADEAKYDPGALAVEINIYGHMSATHSSEIDDKIRELAPYAVRAARFQTEWEAEASCFFIGKPGDVARAESEEALLRIKDVTPDLRGDDVHAAVQHILGAAHMPHLKQRYFRASCRICPFCKSKRITAGPVQANGMTGCSDVKCSGCARTWKNVWAVIDVTFKKNPPVQG